MDDQIELKQEDKSILIDETGVKEILAIRKWTMFFSILGFLFTGISLIFFILFLTNAGNLFAQSSPWLVLPSMLILGVSIIPIYYLFKFSEISKEAITVKGIYTISDAFAYLKKHFKFVGIFTIVVMSIYFLLILGMLVFGGMNNMY